MTHFITGKSASELFFRRKFRDENPLILDMEYQKNDEIETRDRDKIQKKEKAI